MHLFYALFAINPFPACDTPPKKPRKRRRYSPLFSVREEIRISDQNIDPCSLCSSWDSHILISCAELNSLPDQNFLKTIIFPCYQKIKCSPFWSFVFNSSCAMSFLLFIPISIPEKRKKIELNKLSYLEEGLLIVH